MSEPCVISIRSAEPRDVPIMFALQCDPESNRLAGTKPRTEEAFRAVWDKIFGDPMVTPFVIVHEGRVIGSISRFQANGVDSVGYWIDRAYWGRRVVSQALPIFLREVTIRPLHATVARDNVASQRILARNGFRFLGWEMGEETDRYLAREVGSYILD